MTERWDNQARSDGEVEKSGHGNPFLFCCVGQADRRGRRSLRVVFRFRKYIIGAKRPASQLLTLNTKRKSTSEEVLFVSVFLELFFHSQFF